MFDRKKYKAIAKKQLKGRMTTPVLSTLVVLLLIGVLCAPAMMDSWHNAEATVSASDGVFRMGAGTVTPHAASPLPGLITMLLSGVLTIATSYLYIVLSHTMEPQPFSVFIKGFSLWLRGLLGYLWMYLWVFLWTLLFIIPGFVKAISYSQMFFILAECPDVGVTKAMRLSKAMTRGYKWDLFVLWLSFIGWSLLGAVTCGILYLWILPYMNMTIVNAYHALKAQAIRSGVLTEEDFGSLAVGTDHCAGAGSDPAIAGAPAAATPAAASAPAAASDAFFFGDEAEADSDGADADPGENDSDGQDSSADFPGGTF